MKITKMHGLGNDFILTEEVREDYAAPARALCRRRLSVGADGLVVVAPSQVADIRMRIFNADGSEAEMCGNSIRCFARYVYEKGIVAKNSMEIETLAGIMKPELIIEDGRVTAVKVDMGKPDFTPEAIPVLSDTPMDFEVPVGGKRFAASSVLMGVPHTIVFTDAVADVEIEKVGPEIEKHYFFPKKTNVNFVEVVDDGTVKMRTWERGVGTTMACGTGASAAGVITHKKGLTGSSVRVLLEAGELFIENAADGRVFMTGPAAYVFEGETV